MKLVVKIKSSDTTYVLNKDNMTWVRSGLRGLFGTEGRLFSWPDSIIPGKVVSLRIYPEGWFASTVLNFIPSMVFEVGPHDEEMYGVRIPKSKAETQAYIDNYSKSAAVGKDSPPKIGKWVSAKFGAVTGRTSSKHENLSNTPKPVTQADGFADSDPLEFATLPGGGKLRYTDETRTTFRYVPKDEPRKATVCTRNEGHNGPCNGFPRLEREGMCYNSRPNVLVALFHSPNGGYTTLHLVKGTTVTYIAVRETTFAGQVECIRRNAGELEALVYTNSYIFESALNKRGIETRMIQSALLPNGR